MSAAAALARSVETRILRRGPSLPSRTIGSTRSAARPSLVVSPSLVVIGRRSAEARFITYGEASTRRSFDPVANADLLGRFAGSFAAQRRNRATSSGFASSANAGNCSFVHPGCQYDRQEESSGFGLLQRWQQQRVVARHVSLPPRRKTATLAATSGNPSSLQSSPTSPSHHPSSPSPPSSSSPSSSSPSSSTSASYSPSSSGLPRFFSESLPLLMGSAVRLVGSEASHMSRSLRLRPGDLAELFDGQGSIVTVRLESIDRQQGIVLVATEAARKVPFSGPQWTVVAACGMLKGGRSDWLIEKCTELGAVGFIPLVTERSGGKGEGRVDRWERVALAAAKQSQSIHRPCIHDFISLNDLTKQIQQAPFALLGAPNSPPLLAAVGAMDPSLLQKGGLLIVGPEGDFTPSELEALKAAGARAVSLGLQRLRVETAAVAMLAGVSLLAHSLQEQGS